ncbi:MAG: hypothetical protein AAF570_23000, partial [Bacteroidota bacterium]
GELNAALVDVQKASRNCGGRFEFGYITKKERKKDQRTGKKIRLPRFRRRPNPISDPFPVLEQAIRYWSEQGGLPCDYPILDDFEGRLEKFMKMLKAFVEAEVITQISDFGKDSDGAYAIDHANEDFVLETETYVFILHLGWSS